jgi:hypothetical protein
MEVWCFSLVLLLSSAFHTLAWGPKDEQHNKFRGRPGGYGKPQCHDSSFVPDHVLRLTYEDISIGCQTRSSVVVNGTLPGPAIHLKPGKTSWIRVYNDMSDNNATIVRTALQSAETVRLQCSALAWPLTAIGNILGRIPISLSVAHSAASFLRL